MEGKQVAAIMYSNPIVDMPHIYISYKSEYYRVLKNDETQSLVYFLIIYDFGNKDSFLVPEIILTIDDKTYGLNARILEAYYDPNTGARVIKAEIDELKSLLRFTTEDVQRKNNLTD